MGIKTKIKGCLKNVLWSLAWWVLEDHIKTSYIHRAHFNDYTQWMSRDHPIMEDMYEHFKDRPYGGPLNCAKIREEMFEKHIKPRQPIDRNKGFDEMRDAMFKAGASK